MIANLNTLPLDEKIQLVEDLWDSIAEEKAVLPISKEQKRELNRCQPWRANARAGSPQKA